MQRGMAIHLAIISSILLSHNVFTLALWHDKPKATLAESTERIRNPLSLKMLAALTIVNNKTSIPAVLPLELKEYVEFIKENFIPTDTRLYMHGPTINNAILSNRYEILPDLGQILRINNKIDCLNSANLPEERTPLLFAIENEDLKLAHILLEAGANPNTPWPVTTQPPLLLAVKKGNIPLVELLIKHKADIEQTNKIDGSTPLIQAAAHGQLEIVKILLKNGAKKTTHNKHGACAASLAKNHGHKQVFDLVVTPEYLAIVADIKNVLGLS